ncbi:MAG: phenylalanine--tRNA ligase subunit beta [Candidatus Saccharibacteria bacterium]
MIISVNWLKKFTEINLPIDELTTLIGARLVEIEEVIDLGAKYKDVIVVRIAECAPIEGTDHLNVTKIDDGGVTKNVERDGNGLVQVVCGAPNVRAGMLAAWLPVGSTVPSTFSDEVPFVLGARNLRGVISNGMLASATELDLFDDHTGILEIDKELEAGTNFSSAYELDDYLLDIENKSLTHRPDTFGVIGFAREVAAIQGTPFTTPEWLANVHPSFGVKDGDIQLPTVAIDDPELSARYQVVVLSGADNTRQSPLLIKTYLARVGVRPISAVVDVTNYLMMLTGQPLHAFDYDKLVAVSGGSADIHVRVGRQGETLELLDGRMITLDQEDIVISAGETAVGLAGAMGGANTVIDADTKNIIVESATFNLYKLRATQMRHGIFSEAITRFTKGQPAELTAPVLANAIRLLGEWSGAKRVSDVCSATGMTTEVQSIDMTTERVNRILGTSLDADSIAETLRGVEFAVKLDDSKLVIESPYWRGDIHIFEDVVEEIGRLRGFDSIVPTLPGRTFSAVTPTGFDDFRSRVRQALVRSGASEVLTYSFVHGDILQKAGQKLENSYRITNSISPDLQYYRQTLTPSLLGLIHPNAKQGYENFAVFELNKSHRKDLGLTDEGVPVETDNIALTLTSKKAQTGAMYYRAKKILDYMASSLGLNFTYVALAGDQASPLYAPFEYRRSAVVMDDSGKPIGIVGEYKKTISKAFKLSADTAGFEIKSVELFEAMQNLGSSYTPLSRYPSSERDICFQVANDVSYGQVMTAVMAVLGDVELETNVSPVDIYQPEAGATKNITIRIRLTSHVKTLTSADVNIVIEGTSRNVIDSLGAVVI